MNSQIKSERGYKGMKKRIVILKKGVDTKIGPEAFCCFGGLLAYTG
jgi:hypothetical protein